MTPWFLAHPYVRGLLLSLLFFFSLVQLGCLVALSGDTGKKPAKRIVPVILFTCTELLLLRYVNDKTGAVPGFLPENGWRCVYEFPTGAAVITVLILGVCTCRIFGRTVQYYRNSMNQSSIKDSIDNLTTGLSFSAPNGRILLANRRMEFLCREITGMDFQDAGQFWDVLTCGPVCGGALRMAEGDAPCFCLPDGTVWTFGRKVLCVEGSDVIQITAADTTQLHRLSASLQENNRKLEEMNQRLEKYGENMESYVRSREILEAKMRIHNEMGQALLATRSCLLQNFASLQEKDILKRWQYVIALLKKKTEPEDTEKAWNSFIQAAGSAGVRILLDGEIPKEKATVTLLVAAAAEALTNAVRHGEATELSMKLRREERAIRVTFTNNGQNPEGKVTEGGGLESLRLRLEEAGGSLRIETEPGFALVAVVPVWRKENDDESFDCGR